MHFAKTIGSLTRAMFRGLSVIITGVSVAALLLISLCATLGNASIGGPSQAQSVCGSQPGVFAWTYCVTTTTGSTSHQVLYYLHGGPGDAHEWNDLEGVRQAWRAMGAQAPTVVTVSFGPLWLLVEKNASPLSGMYEAFVQEVMPYVEEHLMSVQPTRRALMGLSMGGFSATQLLLKDPGLFQKVVLMCPMLINLSPLATADEIDRARDRSRVPKFDPTNLLVKMRAVIPDEASWQASSPFVLGATNLNAQTPPIYLTYGDKDGFVDGQSEFLDLATRMGAPITESRVPGGHCVGDEAGLAKFLVDP